jgi:putative transposon-encoded protein
MCDWVRHTKQNSIEVICEMATKEGEVVKFHALKLVKPHGDTAYVTMPKALIGKRVIIKLAEVQP